MRLFLLLVLSCGGTRHAPDAGPDACALPPEATDPAVCEILEKQ